MANEVSGIASLDRYARKRNLTEHCMLEYLNSEICKGTHHKGT